MSNSTDTITNLPVKREMFCRYFTLNDTLRNNATQSYAAAYGHKLHELPDDDAVYETTEDDRGKKITKEIVPSTRHRAERMCAANASRLLKYDKVQKRIRELLNELLSDDVVDAELAKVITQNRELPAKNNAIKIYNDIRGRVVNKHEHTGRNGGPIVVSSEKAKSKAARILGLP